LLVIVVSGSTFISL